MLRQGIHEPAAWLVKRSLLLCKCKQKKVKKYKERYKVQVIVCDHKDVCMHKVKKYNER